MPAGRHPVGAAGGGALTTPLQPRYPAVTLTSLSKTSHQITRGLDDFSSTPGSPISTTSRCARARHLAALPRALHACSARRRPVRRPPAGGLARGGGHAALPAHPRHAEPAHHRRALPGGRGPAAAAGRDQLDHDPVLAHPRRRFVERAAAHPALGAGHPAGDDGAAAGRAGAQPCDRPGRPRQRRRHLPWSAASRKRREACSCSRSSTQSTPVDRISRSHHRNILLALPGHDPHRNIPDRQAGSVRRASPAPRQRISMRSASAP